MRKRVFTPTPQGIRSPDEGWLGLDRAASVEVTSEEKDYGIDSALVSGETQGWRAASPGTQTIRLLFDQPQRLTRISLVFEETETERTQEFVLDGLQIAGAHFEKLCASSGIPAHLTQYLNWSLCLTSVEQRLAPRSRVCACLDSGARKQRENARTRMLRQIAEFAAMLACGLFAGAAVYVSLVEHPARMECGVEIATAEFPPSYHRGTIMQVTLAAVCLLSSIAAWLAGARFAASICAGIERRVSGDGIRPLQSPKAQGI